MTKIAVIGAGSWATALAALLANRGYLVTMWTRREDLALEIRSTRENSRYLPGVSIPGNIEITTDLRLAMQNAGTAMFCVPSHAFREVLQECLPLIGADVTCINTAKGIEEKKLYRMSEVFAQIVGIERLGQYVCLSGPSHAEEVGRGLPTAVVLSSLELHRAEHVQDMMMGKDFRVYTNPDLVGVELGGALKNIIAVGTGIADGLGFGDNTKAALMTRGMAEISRLGVAMGANPLTFAGLAGIGDLIVTCTSMHSRNRRAGIAIGQGRSLEEALKDVDMAVEGVPTTQAAYHLAQRYQVELPITEQIHHVLFNNLDPAAAVENLMTRGRTHEVEEVALMRVQLTMKTMHN